MIGIDLEDLNKSLLIRNPDNYYYFSSDVQKITYLGLKTSKLHPDLNQLKNLRNLYFANLEFDNNDFFDQLSELKLKTLSIMNCKNISGLENINKIKSLESLTLMNCGINNDETLIDLLQDIAITNLDLSYNKLKTISNIEKLKKLSTLTLDSNSLNENFQIKHNNIKVLCLNYCDVKNIDLKCDKLFRLFIKGNPIQSIQPTSQIDHLLMDKNLVITDKNTQRILKKNNIPFCQESTLQKSLF